MFKQLLLAVVQCSYCFFLRFELPGNRENLFAITPAYDKWAPWIGPRTRASKTVINTEYAKMNAKKSSVEQAEVEITEERLSSDLMNLKVNCVFY